MLRIFIQQLVIATANFLHVCCLMISSRLPLNLLTFPDIILSFGLEFLLVPLGSDDVVNVTVFIVQRAE